MDTNCGVGVRIPPRPQQAKKGRTFPFGGRKIMIGIADPMLRNLGVGLLSKWGREGLFPLGGRKIMIGIADPMLWNLGVGLLSKLGREGLFPMGVGKS